MTRDQAIGDDEVDDEGCRCAVIPMPPCSYCVEHDWSEA